MSVGHSPEVPQYEPDMPKKVENITAEEMQEARRRIGGSTQPPPDSLPTVEDAIETEGY